MTWGHSHSASEQEKVLHLIHRSNYQAREQPNAPSLLCFCGYCFVLVVAVIDLYWFLQNTGDPRLTFWHILKIFSGQWTLSKISNVKFVRCLRYPKNCLCGLLHTTRVLQGFDWSVKSPSKLSGFFSFCLLLSMSSPRYFLDTLATKPGRAWPDALWSVWVGVRGLSSRTSACSGVPCCCCGSDLPLITKSWATTLRRSQWARQVLYCSSIRSASVPSGALAWVLGVCPAWEVACANSTSHSPLPPPPLLGIAHPGREKLLCEVSIPNLALFLEKRVSFPWTQVWWSSF